MNLGPKLIRGMNLSASRLAWKRSKRPLMLLSARRTELQDDLRDQTTKIENYASGAANAARGDELDELLSSLPKKVKELEGAQKLIGEAESDYRALLHTIEAETSHGLEIKSHGREASCPRCKRAYGDDFEEILAEYSSELSRLELKRSDLETVLQEQRLIEMRLTPQITKLRELQAERVGLGDTGDQGQLKTELHTARVHRAQLEKEIDGATRQLDALGNEQRSKRTRRQLLVKQASHRDAIGLKKREIDDQVDFFSEELKQLGESDYERDVHTKLRDQLQEALDAAKELAEIKRVGEGRELAERRARQAREKAQEALNQKQAEASAALGMQIDPKALRGAEHRAELAEKECDDAEDSLRKAERAAVLESEAVKAARAELARVRQQARRIAKERRELRYRVAVAQGLEAYRADSSRRAVPQLEAETAHLLSQVTGGRYTDVHLTEEYALEIVDNGSAHPLKRFSGGEQDLASLCLRLAISKALARQRGADASFVILDEVFGSQDLVRRQSLIDQLRELNREFRQVFIVSHFDDVAEMCDCQISVSLEDGVSQAVIRA